MNRSVTSRRRFLQGVGVTLALPWLETPTLRASDSPGPQSNQRRHRFACMFMANGVNPQDWGAEGDGDDGGGEVLFVLVLV